MPSNSRIAAPLCTANCFSNDLPDCPIGEITAVENDLGNDVLGAWLFQAVQSWSYTGCGVSGEIMWFAKRMRNVSDAAEAILVTAIRRNLSMSITVRSATVALLCAETKRNSRSSFSMQE